MSIHRLVPSAAACLLATLLTPTICRPATGPTTPTFALAWGNYGAAPGQFQFAPGVTTDALGNVYVADQGNHRIQKFDRLGNLIQIWGSFGAGNGQFSSPGGIGTDAAGNVYVADTGNNRIQKFSATGAYLAQWGSSGPGNGQFNSPTGAAVDAAGNVYVADYGNQRIQKFSATGAYITKWGTIGSGNGQFNGPFAVGLDPTGNVYVADVENCRIQKFTADGVYVTKWGTPGNGDGQLNRAAGVAADAVGNIYVADNDNHRIQKFSAEGTFITKWGSVGSAAGQFVNPEGIAVDAAGNVYIADYNNNRIQKFSGAGVALSEAPGAFLLKWGSAGSGNGQFQYPFGVATDAAGNVYVTDALNHRIQKFTGTGSYLTQWGSLGSGNGQFNFPIGVATDAAGNVYVADTQNHRIQKFTSTGTFLLKWGSNGTGNGQFNQPLGVGLDAAGNVYVTDSFNARVQKFTSTGAYLAQWGSNGTGAGQFASPWGIATDAFGNVYVADRDNFRIEKFTSTGAFVTQWSSADVAGLATAAGGAVFAVGRDMNVIQEFTSTGTLVTQWGSLGTGDGQIQYPRGVATDAAGNIYVADGDNHRIQKLVRPPSIALVSDIRNDQGRQARLRILRSSADSPGSGASILRYDVYRRIDPLPATARVATTPGVSPASVQLAGWEQVGSISARGDGEYNVVVPTLLDATAASLEYSAFFVSAVTADPFVYFDSGAENGYSIDNLPPPTPSPFFAAYASGATHLHWTPSTAGDFAEFRLYRGATAGFVPGSGNLVAAVADTGYADVGAAGSYYKLSAVDWNGNESAFALVSPTQTTGATGEAPLALALDGTRPNPARGDRMLIHFALPNAEPATLELFDLAGRRVAGRAVGSLGGGRHAVDLAPERRLPAGMYLIRLAQGASQLTARSVILD